ncbi:hypothetical protein GCM10028857_05030 [Salinarchaeum chitinilyticum]
MSDGPTFTVGPRVEFEVGGYVRIRAYSSDLGRDCYVYLHRLTAWAHGELASPWESDDPRHAHHAGRDGWDNRPDLLEAVHPAEHGRDHRAAQLDA